MSALEFDILPEELAEILDAPREDSVNTEIENVLGEIACAANSSNPSESFDDARIRRQSSIRSWQRPDSVYSEDQLTGYFRALGNFEQLTEEETVVLCRVVQKADRLREDPEVEENELTRAIEKAKEALDHLVLAHLPLVIDIAKKYPQSNIFDFTDYIQQGSIALLSVIHEFDGVHKFASYAGQAIRNKLQRYAAHRGAVRISDNKNERLARQFVVQNLLGGIDGEQANETEDTKAQDSLTDVQALRLMQSISIDSRIYDGSGSLSEKLIDPSEPVEDRAIELATKAPDVLEKFFKETFAAAECYMLQNIRKMTPERASIYIETYRLFHTRPEELLVEDIGEKVGCNRQTVYKRVDIVQAAIDNVITQFSTDDSPLLNKAS